MHISKYTFLFKGNEGECYVYNTLSNALVEIDEAAYNKKTSTPKLPACGNKFTPPPPD